MPRKPGEGAPLQGGETMSEQTREEVFGGTGPHQGKGALKEGEHEEGERHYSGASQSERARGSGPVQKAGD
jgi:hypothetical protein